MPKYSVALDRVLQALSCPTRRIIVERLTHGTATVSELAAPLDMALPSVMQHLKLLEDCGIIRTRKQGRVRTCQLEPDALTRPQRWFASQLATWESRLDRLDDYLKELQSKEKEDDSAK